MPNIVKMERRRLALMERSATAIVSPISMALPVLR
jgi:hypothetical protein